MCTNIGTSLHQMPQQTLDRPMRIVQYLSAAFLLLSCCSLPALRYKIFVLETFMKSETPVQSAVNC
jgi:hypothetical protein